MTTKEIIELSASVLCSLATAAACIISLWQTKVQIGRKLKLKNRAVIQETGGNIQVFLGLDIINMGYMKVIVREWRVPLKKGKKIILIPEGSFQAIHLPYKLEPGDSICLLFSLEKFKNQLKELRKQGFLNKNNKLKFEIVDSVDNVYSIKIPPVNKWLETNNN